MDFIVEADWVTCGYGEKTVLRDLCLRVPRASIYGFLGPNGAGKTTALRMLVGLLHPQQGEARLFGERLPAALPRILRRAGALIEQPSLYEHLTGEENMELVRKLKGLKRSDTGRAICALGMEWFASRLVAEYSRGMRQRLGVAMAVIGNPELLLLDEPMNGLDPGSLQTFLSLLHHVHREYGTTVVLSSHQLEQVDRVATHIGILGPEGGLLFEGTREELAMRVPQHLLIKVDRRDDALAALTNAGFAVDSSHEHLVIHSATAATAEKANRVLVTNGVGVHHLSLELTTLERQFESVLATSEAGQRI